MMIMKKVKRETMEGIELLTHKNFWMLRDKENYKYLGIVEVDTIKQREMKEEKRKEHQALQQKSHHRNKHLSNATCKVLWTIFKMDKEGA